MRKTILVLITAFLCNSIFAQTNVTGKVTASEDGSPISFVNVHAKGTMNGTTTDESGTYTLSNVATNAVLVFTFVGYKTIEVPVNGRAIVNATMESDAMGLDEVMVVAYGTAKKGSYSGSATTVRAASINDLPVANFESSMAGNVAGLQLNPGSGQVGSSVSIRIRGTGSMNASNDPLYVIDGVPVESGNITNWDYSSNNALSSLNPSDIQSITVLKDAAASSLYGSRAANGVVIVTTKAGSSGKMRVNFKANVGFTPSFAYYNLEKASPEDQKAYNLDLYTAWRLNEEAYPTYDLARAQAEIDYRDRIGDDPRGYFDWEDALLKTASVQNYDISVQGGNDKSSFFTSIGYTKEEGRAAANALDRWSGRLNLKQKVFSNLEINSNISYSSINKSGFNDTYNNGANYFLMARNLLFDNWWPQNPDGTWHTDPWRTYAQNVIYWDNFRESTSRTNQLILNESATLEILDGLVLKTQFAYDEIRLDNYYWRAPNHYQNKSSNGRIEDETYRISRMTSTTTMTYDQTFAGSHHINVLAGWEALKRNVEYLWAVGSDLPTLTAKTIATAGTKSSNGYDSGYNMLSAFSRLEYDYKAKYFFSASFRRDGTSKFGPDVRWGNFWSVAGSWSIHKESFMSTLDYISNLRLKASYGINGTWPGSNYGHISLFAFAQNYNDKPGGKVSTIADPSLTWETSYTYNIGAELGLLDNRIFLSLEYYNRDSKNLLQNVPVSRITGFSNILTNFGAMNNQGLEIELGGEIIRTNDIRWSLSVNASTLKSRITKLYEGADILWYDPTGGDNQARFVYREGESPKSFWGKQWAGVDPDTGHPMWFINRESYKESDVYKTVDGRPVTNKWATADYVITGCADPKLHGGINTDFSWKGFTVYLNFIYSLGGDAFNTFERYVNDDGYFTTRTRSKKAMDYWKQPGDITQGTKLGLAESELFNRDQDRYLYKNNFIRLKNTTISYNLPKSWVEKVKVSNCRIYFSGTNILTFANQKEFDPEVSAYGVRGWEMPLGKTYTFGVELSF